MPSSQDTVGTSIDDSAPVALALEKSQEVKAKVEACAEDIGHSNVAVQTRIAEGATTLPAHETLAKGREVEGKVQECADDLLGVTQTLAKGVEDLKQIETALAHARIALTKTKAFLATAKKAEQEARQQALHDSTTGLPNRKLFDTRLEQAIAMAKRHDWTLAVMFLDLDRFKAINDVHGHAAGDAVLKEIAGRLSKHVREEDAVCRNGGDEFLYLLVDPQGRENIERIARGVVERISQPVCVGGLRLAVGASIGIAVYPGNAQRGDDLIRQADAAMYRAKQGKTGCAFAENVETEGAAA